MVKLKSMEWGCTEVKRLTVPSSKSGTAVEEKEDFRAINLSSVMLLTGTIKDAKVMQNMLISECPYHPM